MLFFLRRLLVGSPLPNSAEQHERLPVWKALAVFSSDALSSVAYATEEILLVLVVGGTAFLGYSLPIAILIAILLAIVATSYFQTVHGYPNGGGAYIVAHENLGIWAGLTAGTALLIDYVLTVAVSITAGIVAVTSAFPQLQPLRIELCLAAIALITWANLRGVRESGTVFALPTYGFIIIFFLLILAGLGQLATGQLPGHPPQENQADMVDNLGLMGFLLLVRAFSSGCTALTGIEAISNGIPAFKPPEPVNAGRTLILMATLLAAMFLGITYLAFSLGIAPREHESVVSQIGRLVFGDGILYYALQFFTTTILILAANTSYADFPRLSSLLAKEGYLPRQMANRGDRLVFANGIICLALLAGFLVVLFGGNPHKLIPLYAVGVFLSFTLSQAGMVLHWNKVRGSGWQWRAVVNGLGAVVTTIVLLAIIESKFIHGAWIVLLLIPLGIWTFRTIHDHYRKVAVELQSEEELPSFDGVSPRLKKPYKVVVPLSSINRASLAALDFACSLSKDVTACIVDLDPARTKYVMKSWKELNLAIPLEVLESPYRSVIEPLLNFLGEMDKRHPERGPTIIVLAEPIPSKWWERLLHNNTAVNLKSALLYRRDMRFRDRVIIAVPYHLKM